jgi:signal transduction histidine kinase
VISTEASARGATSGALREPSDADRSLSRRFWIVEALVTTAYVTLAVGLGILSREPPHSTPLGSMVILGLCGLAVIAARHRYPRLAVVGALMLTVLSLAVGSGAESLLAVTATYTSGVHRTGWGAWASFGGALLSGALGALALTLRGSVGPPILGLAPPELPRDTLLDWANMFVIIAVVLVIAALLGTNVGHRRRHISELVDRAERLARERDQDMEIARSRERERIAREMHDVIAHSLSVVIAVSDGAHAAADNRPDEAKKAIASVAAIGRRTLGEVRRLLSGVRNEHGSVTGPDSDSPQPDVSELPALAADFTAAGLPVRLIVTGSPSADPVLGLTVYRIVQESLTNALRHARQTESATVSVTWATGHVGIRVRDLGLSAPASSNAGRGIVGMRERVALYDGEFEAGPHSDGGWLVFAQLRYGESQP